MIINYIKLALKVLARRKFFTFISLFGISLTLVVLMVATAMLDNVFAPRSPESRLDRMLVIYTIGLHGAEGGLTGSPGYKFLDRYARNLDGAEATSFFTHFKEISLFHGGRKSDSHIRRTDGAYWQILDFRFLEGQPFTQLDDDNARFVAVINESTRAKVFGSEKAAGKTIDVDGQRFRVVGVVEDVPITRLAAFSQIWVPVQTAKSGDYKRNTIGEFAAVVLAKSKSDLPKLKNQFDQRMRSYHFEDPKRHDRIRAGLDTTFEAAATALVPSDLSKSGPAILRSILIAMALLFITLPTMNLVSINLSRIMERASEIGVRRAFGASSRTLIGQFVTENVVLTVLGGLIGFGLSAVLLAVLNSGAYLPHVHFDLNLRIFAYAIGLAALFGIISGVYPAWRMSRLDPVNALRGGVK
jgi:putative ABC transport system permease protein